MSPVRTGFVMFVIMSVSIVMCCPEERCICLRLRSVLCHLSVPWPVVVLC